MSLGEGDRGLEVRGRAETREEEKERGREDKKKDNAKQVEKCREWRPHIVFSHTRRDTPLLEA